MRDIGGPPRDPDLECLGLRSCILSKALSDQVEVTSSFGRRMSRRRVGSLVEACKAQVVLGEALGKTLGRRGLGWASRPAIRSETNPGSSPGSSGERRV